MTPILEAMDLVRHYRLPRERLLGPAPLRRAVDGVSFAIAPGASFGVVGESGSGKSTLARMSMALDRPTAGTVLLDGADLFALPAAALRRRRHRFQMIFQDPQGSLDPRASLGRSVAEPLAALPTRPGRAERQARVAAALEAVGLAAADAERYPHELSGGQRQRVAIARALITHPALIVADEPVSALDMSIQAQILNLMVDMRGRYGVAYLLISHNLAVVAHVTDTVAVMYRGRFVETGPTADLFARPAHPYTSALLAAAPDPRRPGRRPRRTSGDAPAATGGCPYRLRCSLAFARCADETPVLRSVAPGRKVACHLDQEPV